MAETRHLLSFGFRSSFGFNWISHDEKTTAISYWIDVDIVLSFKRVNTLTQDAPLCRLSMNTLETPDRRAGAFTVPKDTLHL